MKKIIISFCLLLSSAVLSYGQSYDQEIDFGVRAGYGVTNYSNIKRSDLPPDFDYQNYGYAFGIFMQLRVNHIYFQPELLYTNVTSIIMQPLETIPNTTAELDLGFNSLQVPLIVGYRTGFGETAFRIGAGAYFNFLLSNNGKLIIEPGGELPIDDVDPGFLDNFNTLTLGARFNAGLDFGPFMLDVSYQSGFGRLSEEIGNLGGDLTRLGKERTWSFALGYKLIRSRR